MNFKTTLFLLLVAGGVVALFWKGPELGLRLGLATKPDDAADKGTVGELAGLKSGAITRINVEVPNQRPVVFASPKPGSPLELLGNWPPRRQELGELLDLLTHLQSRFQPVPIDANGDLKPYGLDPSQNPIRVTVDVGNESQLLTFGEEDRKQGENPFVRSAYVRLGAKPELLRLGPDVMPILRRTEDAYRRRQLFPEATERVKLVERTEPRPGSENQTVNTPTVTILGDAATRIAVSGPAGRFVLERIAPTPKPSSGERANSEPKITPEQLAASWIIVEPYRDRVDPAKLGAILTAIPELMVEQFEDKKVTWFQTGLTEKSLDKFLTAVSLTQPLAAGPALPIVAAFGLGIYELAEPPMTLTVTLADGSSRELVLGNVSRATSRIEQSPPMFPGQPPQPNIITEEYRYAKIGSNPLVFELKDNRLNDIFLSKAPAAPKANLVRDLRDPRVLRFEPANVNRIEIAYQAEPREKAGSRHIELKRIPGDKKAKDAEARQDRWEMVKPVRESIDSGIASELFDLVKGMEARGESIIDLTEVDAAGGAGTAKLADMGLTPDRVRYVTLETDKGKKVLQIGIRDAEGKRFVRVPEWERRVSRVNDPVDANQLSKLDRPPSSYRMLKLFDTAVSKIREVVVQRPESKESFSLTESAGGDWGIATPFVALADQTSLRPALASLANLASPKLIHDPATDRPLTFSPWPTLVAELGIAAPVGESLLGFDKPALLITLKFDGPPGAADIVVEVGNARSPTEFYARVQGTTGVFALPASIVKELDQRPESLVDRSLIQFPGRVTVQSVRRTMDGQELEIAQNNSTDWEIVKPAQAKADQAKVGKWTDLVSKLRAERIEAVAPKDLKPFGLAPPLATLTVDVLSGSKALSKSLLIGGPVKADEPKGARYVQAQGSTQVAVVPGPMAEQLLAPATQFRDLNLAGFTRADAIAIERPDRLATFAKGATGWKMTAPVEAAAEDEDLRELHDMLAQLRAEQLVEDSPKDLAKYGLDKPIRWRVADGKNEVLHLLVGNREKIGPDLKTDGSRVYAMLNKGNTVALLDPLLSTKLLSEYRKRDLWELASPDAVKEVAINAVDPTNSFKFVRGPKGFSDPAKPNDALNPQLINDLLFVMSGLRAQRFVVDKDADLAKFGLDKPWSVTIVLDDGMKHAVLLGNAAEGNKRYAKLDDPKRSDVFLIGDFDNASLDRPRAAYTVVPKKEPELPKVPEPAKEKK